MDLVEEIKKDILSQKKVVKMLKSLKMKDLPIVHFSIGMYIRNKYIWSNESNFQKLSQYYKLYTADEISSKIIKEIYLQVNKIDNIIFLDQEDNQ